MNWRDNLNRMKSLTKGWNGYEAEPPTEDAIVETWRFIEFLEDVGLEPNRVAPTAVNGVLVHVPVQCGRVIIEFYNDGTTCAGFMIDGKIDCRAIDTNCVALRALVAEIKELAV